MATASSVHTSCKIGIISRQTSFEVKILNESDDLTACESVWEICLKTEHFGNARYDVIIEKKGHILKDWSLESAYFSCNWNISICEFSLRDEFGTIIKNVKTRVNMGTAQKESYLLSCCNTVLTEAKKLISKYPSAKVYNALEDLRNCKPSTNFNKFEILKKKIDDEDVDTVCDYYVNDIINPLKKYLDKYREVRDMLEEMDDERTKTLLYDMESEFKEILKKVITMQ